jgi:hypothetical protein
MIMPTGYAIVGLYLCPFWTRSVRRIRTTRLAITVERYGGAVAARSCGARHFLRTNAYTAQSGNLFTRPTSLHMADITDRPDPAETTLAPFPTRVLL